MISLLHDTFFFLPFLTVLFTSNKNLVQVSAWLQQLNLCHFESTSALNVRFSLQRQENDLFWLLNCEWKLWKEIYLPFSFFFFFKFTPYLNWVKLVLFCSEHFCHWLSLKRMNEIMWKLFLTYFNTKNNQGLIIVWIT